MVTKLTLFYFFKYKRERQGKLFNKRIQKQEKYLLILRKLDHQLVHLFQVIWMTQLNTSSLFGLNHLDPNNLLTKHHQTFKYTIRM